MTRPAKDRNSGRRLLAAKEEGCLNRHLNPRSESAYRQINQPRGKYRKMEPLRRIRIRYNRPNNS